MRPHRITALGVNMVPQIANVFADLSVLENLEIGAILNRHRLRERLDVVLTALPPCAGCSRAGQRRCRAGNDRCWRSAAR